MELLVVLLTGLTTGGLTCLAVQGGLLASVVSAQANDRLQSADAPLNPPNVAGLTRRQRKGRKDTPDPVVVPTKPANGDGMVVAFLLAKLIAYTALGALLGATGALIGVSPTMRGWLQLFAGLYMVAIALNLLEVHPVFRYVVLQLPAFLARRVRLASRSASYFAPVSLGAMTVLIPCGTTLAVEFLALSTGDPLYAAALMFAFTAGTMPVFYTLGRFTTRLSGERHAHLMGFTAATVLLLGALSINTSMTLLDSPLTYRRVEANLASLPQRITGRELGPGAPTKAAAAPVGAGAGQSANASNQPGSTAAPTLAGDVNTAAASQQVLRLDVKSTAYSPNRLQATANQPIRLELATANTQGCTRAFTIPSLGVQKILPATGTTVVEIPAQKPGTLRFTCSMGMYSGAIVIS